MNAHPWYDDLADAIETRIEQVCALYPVSERAQVIGAVTRALHRRANEADPACAWLSIMHETVSTPCPRQGGRLPRTEHSIHHPSNGDAEDVAEDVCLMPTPYGPASPTITIRAAVLVAWTRFVSTLSHDDRDVLAIDAAHYA